ncbi:unnamed protein product [Caenorhabditis angaria]|uniref:Uncharacterized protein n=1 Tax=Caenorhabditis angaria TaxID=860376 RepID=A0A9P1I6S7_9PELO|nr:unnamed protein product [Caenorhabditis angaria]
MSDCFIPLTNQILVTLLERYIPRTKLCESDKDVIRKNDESFKPLKLLTEMIENSEGRLDIYGPADKLLKDLRKFLVFQQNFDFLGFPNQMVYGYKTQRFVDQKNKDYLPKTSIFCLIYLSIRDKCDENEEVCMTLIESFGNRVYRNLKNCYELVSNEVGNEVLKKLKDFQFLAKVNLEVQNAHLRLSEYNIDKFFENLVQFYDSEYDQEFLNRLRNHLISLQKTKPIQSDMHFYQMIYATHICYTIFCQNLIQAFPYVFQPFDRLTMDKSMHFPIIQQFSDNGVRFYMTNEWKAAAIYQKGLQIPMETEEERKKYGILNTVSVTRFTEVCRKAKYNSDSICKIDQSYKRTTSGIAIPIISHFGTHCKLAIDVFNEIFEIFSIEFRWFDSTDQKDIGKINNWFEELGEVFSETKKSKYLIELWKIDELKEKAYKEMEKYVKKPKYEIENKIFSKKEEIRKELEKLYGNKMEHELWEKEYLKIIRESNNRNITKGDIMRIYNSYLKHQFIQNNSKFQKFFHNQLDCIIDDGFSCDCSYSSQKSEKMNEKIEIMKLEEINHRYISFLNNHIFFIFTKNGQSYYDNDSCIKRCLDFMISKFPKKSKELIGIIFKYEIEKIEKMKRNVIYLTGNEYEQYQNEIILFFDNFLMKNETLEEKEMDIREARKLLKEKYGSLEIIDEIEEEIKKSPNIVKIIITAKQLVDECFERIKSLKDYYRINSNRKIILRHMCEWRIEEQNEWHLFAQEVLEAVEIILENEHRLGSMRAQIEKWRNTWNCSLSSSSSSNGHFSIIQVKLLETILKVVGINGSKIILVPEIGYCRSLIEIPLTMGYSAMKIQSPDGKMAYHEYHALSMIFQFGACDIYWGNEDQRGLKNKHRKKILEEIAKIKKGYSSLEIVEQSMEKVMYSEIMQKTPITFFHNKKHSFEISTNQLSVFSKLSKMRSGFPLGYNISAAFTVNYPILALRNSAEFWEARLNRSYPFNIEAINECIRIENENEAINYESRKTGFVINHYFFDDDDCLGMTYKQKKEAPPKKSIKIEKNVDESLANILGILPEVVELHTSPIYQSISKLWEKFEMVLSDEYDMKYARILLKKLKTPEIWQIVEKKLAEFMDFDDFKGNVRIYRIKMETKKEDPKPVEKAKIETKIEIETKIVENCEKCREINEEMREYSRKLRDFERNLEENSKKIEENEREYIRKGERLINEKMKSIKASLENSKFSDKNKQKRIEELLKKNSDLKTRIFIENENTFYLQQEEF